MMDGKDKNNNNVEMKAGAEARLKLFSQELKLVADENRLGILRFLKSRKSASVGEIADNLKISFKATSKHLLRLEKKGILVRCFDNPFVHYSLARRLPAVVRKIISHL